MIALKQLCNKLTLIIIAILSQILQVEVIVESNYFIKNMILANTFITSFLNFLTLLFLV